MAVGKNSRNAAESRGAPQTMLANRLSDRFVDQGASKLGRSTPRMTPPPNRSGLPQQVRYRPPTGQVEAPNGSVKHPRPVRQNAVVR
jgi:hypothetical protein